MIYQPEEATTVRKILGVLACSLFLPASYAAESEPTISDFEFLVGYWEGSGFGGQSEEMWMPPRDGRMFGIFKQSSDSQLQFSEFLEIAQEAGTFVVRLRHFNNDFTAWEEKAEYVTFPLVSVETNKAVFRGLSYELIAEDQLQIELVLQSGDGSRRTEFFNLTRKALD